MMNDWPAVASICAVVTLVSAALGAYLRLAFRAAIAEFRLELRKEYVRREDCPFENCPVRQDHAAAGAD
jgi:hypothetical protein